MVSGVPPHDTPPPPSPSLGEGEGGVFRGYQWGRQGSPSPPPLKGRGAACPIVPIPRGVVKIKEKFKNE